jgi:CO dehydrogenase/acetyl-CoA synthase gamma subunit (corrinoid Fe-S protein)
VGNPGLRSPVLVTGNYDLTVRHVLRALQGLDTRLLVVPSAGINVWCAAAGGHPGTQQVVTALKTSGVDDAILSGKVLGLASQLTPERICCRESFSEQIAGRCHE